MNNFSTKMCCILTDTRNVRYAVLHTPVITADLTGLCHMMQCTVRAAIRLAVCEPRSFPRSIGNDQTGTSNSI